MHQVPVVKAWIVNAFENSSEFSEYYLEIDTGNIKFFSPMDFPAHCDRVKKLDRQPERYARLPKLDRDFSAKVETEFIDELEDSALKKHIEHARATGSKLRNALMKHEQARRHWYKFQNDKYWAYLKECFKEQGIELVEKLPADNLEMAKKRQSSK